MFSLHLLCFSRGAQISTKDTEIPQWALLYTRVKETELKYLHFSNVHQLHLSGSTWRQSRAKNETIFWFAMRKIRYAAHRDKTMTSSNKTVLAETKHNKTRDIIGTHITKIVFTGLINLHLSCCEWQALYHTWKAP